MLKKQMNDLVGDFTWILKDNGADGRFATPIPRLLTSFSRDSQSVHRIGPGRIRTLPLIQCGKGKSGYTVRFAGCDRFQRFRVQQSQGR